MRYRYAFLVGACISFLHSSKGYRVSAYDTDHFIGKVLRNLCTKNACVIVNVRCDPSNSVVTEHRASVISAQLTEFQIMRLEDSARGNPDWIATYKRCLQNNAKYIAFSCTRELTENLPSTAADMYLHELAVRYLIQDMGIPVESLVSALMTTPFQPTSVNFGHVSYPQIFAVFTDRDPTLWTAFRVGNFRYLEFVDMVVNLNGLGIEIHDKLETFVDKIRGPLRKLPVKRILFKKSGGSEQPFGLNVVFEDSPNTSINIAFTLQKTTDELQASQLAAFEAPYVSLAKVPLASKTVQVAETLLKWPFWIALVAVTAPIAVLQRARIANTYFDLLFSLWTPLTLEPRHDFLALGAWLLLGQIFGLVFRGSIVATLQALPENRIKAISRCESFNDLGSKHIAKVASFHPTIFVQIDLQFFIRGGVLCQEEHMLDALRRKLLFNHSVYSVDQEKPQYKTISLLAGEINVLDNVAAPVARYNVETVSNDLCCVRVSQFILSRSFISYRPGPTYATLVSDYQRYMKLPLSVTYNRSICVSSTAITKGTWPVLWNARCVEPHDMETNESWSHMEDMLFCWRLLLIGTGIATAFLAIDFVTFFLETRSSRRASRRL